MVKSSDGQENIAIKKNNTVTFFRKLLAPTSSVLHGVGGYLISLNQTVQMLKINIIVIVLIALCGCMYET